MTESRPSARARPRRLLIVNPNGNPEITAKVQACADRVLDADCQALAIHPAGSPHSIETRADRALAEPLALALLSQHRGFDGYVMACFDDIAIDPARRFLTAPIIDAVEASIVAARRLAGRFAIVTTVDSMVPGIRALIDRHGATDQCTVRAAGVGVAAAAAGDAETLARLDEAIVRARQIDGAEAIILGSGGLTGHARRLSERHGLPVIDCIEAAVILAQTASGTEAPHAV
ncbi:MAG: aspartate/glutamate racemase family protein [Pararhodobacter sp.]|nr:aspartate/glutamate racemase family protein [Pararhodobacter sp.]